MRRAHRLAFSLGARAAKTTGAAPLALALFCAAAATAGAQDATPVYQQQKQQSFRFAGDSLARYEWTRNEPDGSGGLVNESRWRVQLRPRVEATIGPFDFGVGGEFNYSKDRNYEDASGATPPLIRDNYRSRDARLDLAFARLKLGPVVAQGGRFFMPLPLTELIWDRDLRPQGGAAGIEITGKSGSLSRFAVTGIYAKGSHVFEDQSLMYGGGVELKLATNANSSFQVLGSYLQFDKLDRLEPAIRRQNTRLGGLIVNDYRVVDVVARISSSGQVPLTLVGDYCWNTALSSGNRGLWLALVLGSTELSRARAEYTYAKVDRDATLAAFNTDDFFWGTGWEGHRADLGTSMAKGSSIHAIVQWQRFKDSPDPVVSQQWVTRYRVEWRTSY
ncbi:MAG: hypothetical protein ACM3PV_16050 [Betaproteobacteria bacterium]